MIKRDELKNGFKKTLEKLLKALGLDDDLDDMYDDISEYYYEQEESVKKSDKTPQEAITKAEMSGILGEIENLEAANKLFGDGAKFDNEERKRCKKLLEILKKIKSSPLVNLKLKVLILNEMKSLKLKLQESTASIEEIKQKINENDAEIERLTKDIEKLHKSLNIKIDWQKANSLSTEKRLEYFDNLAEAIAKIPVYEPVMVLCGSNDPFIVNKKDQEVFRTCYDEVRNAKIKLDKEKKNKELGITQKISFNIDIFRELNNTERMNYCTQLINKIYSAPVKEIGVERKIGKKIISIDSRYAQDFDYAVKGYLMAKRDRACEIDWKKVQKLSPQEKMVYFDKVAENIHNLPILNGEKEKVVCGGVTYTIRKGYKNTFETCYQELKRAEKENEELQKKKELQNKINSLLAKSEPVEPEKITDIPVKKGVPILVKKVMPANINFKTLKTLQKKAAICLTIIADRIVKYLQNLGSQKKLQKTL